MKKIKKYFQKRGYLLILIAITFLLLIVKIAMKKENVAPPETVQKPQEIVKAENLKALSTYGQIVDPEKIIIKISGSDFQKLPENLSIFTLNPDSKSKKLAKDLSSSNIFNANTRLVVYAGKLSLIKQLLNSEEAQYLVKNKLVSWNLITTEAKANIKGYNPIGFELEPASSLETAEIWKISFTQEINGLPLLGVNAQNNVAEATLDNYGNLIGLSAYLLEPNEETKIILPLKNYNKVLQEIFEGRIEVIRTIDLNGEQFSPPPTSRIKNISLEKVTLAYLIGIDGQKVLSPFFIFEGNLNFISGETNQAVMILSATENQL